VGHEGRASQIDGCFSETRLSILGTKGTAEIGGRADEIKGENPWRYRDQGAKKSMYQIEHDELFLSIRDGKPINDGAPRVTPASRSPGTR
jgi:hypothetical protein